MALTSLAQELNLTSLVMAVDEFSDQVHALASFSEFYIGEAHHLSHRLQILEAEILGWDNRALQNRGHVIPLQHRLQIARDTDDLRAAVRDIQGYFNFHYTTLLENHTRGESSSSASSSVSLFDGTSTGSEDYTTASSSLSSGNSNQARWMLPEDTLNGIPRPGTPNTLGVVPGTPLTPRVATPGTPTTPRVIPGTPSTPRAPGTPNTSIATPGTPYISNGDINKTI